MSQPPTAKSATHGNLAAKTPALPGHWSFADLTGRLTELSGLSSTSLAIGLVHEAQQRSEPAAWITCRSSTFFPPDANDAGVDLAALPVIFVADETAAARAADQLLRSGAFGLLVLDLGTHQKVPMPLQTRLVGLAQKHDTAVVFLTAKLPRSASLSSLVSLRASSWREVHADDRFGCGIEVLKDKRHGPGWSHQEVRRGPAGVC